MKTVTSIRELKLIANQIRQDLVLAIYKAGSGHPGGSLGMVDVLTALYFNILQHDPKNPVWQDRDYFVLSNGHICPALYATLAPAGYFHRDELLTLRKLGSRLQGHPYRTALPGLETSSGPLGSGLSQAAGMALALKMDSRKNRVYCMVSDGEQDAGQNWEAAMFAAKYQLNNLTAILDRNNIQIDGTTEEIMPIEPLAKKYQSFGWKVLEIDAHNFRQIIKVCHKAKKSDRPTMIIAHSILGKGVSFMENKPKWHGEAPNEAEAKAALEELGNERLKLLK